MTVFLLANQATTTDVARPPAQEIDIAHADWSVWETKNQHHALSLGGGPLFWRRMDARGSPSVEGWEAGIGSRALVRVRPFVLSSTTELRWRTFDSASYAISYGHGLAVGLSLGPVEPEVVAQLSLLTVDAFHGNWSAELFVPRVATGAWLRVGRVAVGGHVFGEYLWRWLGNGNVLSHGALLSLEIETR